MLTSLYKRDLNLWCEDTVSKLKARNFENLDIENLIEEIASLANRDRRELRSRLVVLLEHLLKRKYVDNYYNFRGWELTIREQLNQIEALFEQSPSLKSFFSEILIDQYLFALSQVKIGYPQVNFPQDLGLSPDVSAFFQVIELDLAAFQLKSDYYSQS